MAILCWAAKNSLRGTILDLDILPILDLGSRGQYKAPDPGSGTLPPGPHTTGTPGIYWGNPSPKATHPLWTPPPTPHRRVIHVYYVRTVLNMALLISKLFCRNDSMEGGGGGDT